MSYLDDYITSTYLQLLLYLNASFNELGGDPRLWWALEGMRLLCVLRPLVSANYCGYTVKHSVHQDRTSCSPIFEIFSAPSYCSLVRPDGSSASMLIKILVFVVENGVPKLASSHSRAQSKEVRVFELLLALSYDMPLGSPDIAVC